MTNPERPTAQLVKDHDVLLVDTTSGLVRIAIDGTNRTPVAPAKYRVLDYSPHGDVLVMSDSDTNLYFHDGSSATPRRVSPLDNRAGNAALRPDNKVVAVTRHADFDLPQSDWGKTEDDAVYLIDVATLAVDVIPKSRDELVTSLSWYPDGKTLFLGMVNFDRVRLDVAARTHTKTTESPYPDGASRLPRAHPSCERTGETLVPGDKHGDAGIDVVDKAGVARRLIVIEGRSRGFHDYLATVNDIGFTSSCRYAYFTYLRTVWIVDVASGEVARLIEGWTPRLLE